MNRWMRSMRRKVLLATLVVAACGAAAVLVFLPRHSAPPGYRVDIARLPGLQHSLSATFTVEVQPTQTVTREHVDRLAAALKTFTVTPPECLNATANFDQTVGTVVASLSAHNQQFGVVIKATESPRPFAEPRVIDACRTFDVERPDGAVSRTHVIEAPVIDGAITSATHSIQTVEQPDGERVIDQYEYVALLDDRHMVSVTSFANPTDTKAVGAAMSGLLADAVNTVRWRG
jgi:Domain of unknown function (DUF5642)